MEYIKRISIGFMKSDQHLWDYISDLSRANQMGYGEVIKRIAAGTIPTLPPNYQKLPESVHVMRKKLADVSGERTGTKESPYPPITNVLGAHMETRDSGQESDGGNRPTSVVHAQEAEN